MTGAVASGVPETLVAEAKRFAEDQREPLVELCRSLVAARSDQPGGDTTEAAAVLAGFLRRRGLEPTFSAAVPTKPNLVCSIGEGGRHLILNGHLDTLPTGADGEWTVPLFAMGRANGRLTGLGIGNMKAGVAALALAFTFLQRRPELARGRVTITAVADEVVFGPHGAAHLLDHDPTLIGDAVLNAEGPGDLGVAVAEKGLAWIELRVEAPPGQGMLATRGSGAVSRMAALLTTIDGWNDESVTMPDEIAAVAAHAGPNGTRLSVNVGRIEGGSFISQVATVVRAEVDMRLPPGLTIQAIASRLDELVASHQGASWRLMKGWNPNWTALHRPIVADVLDAAMAVRGAARPVVRLPASDAARWRQRGIPTVCFGPQRTEASGPDDAVREQDVVDCVAVTIVAALTYLRAGTA